MSSIARIFFVVFFFFNDTATTEIYTLSLHDALPISLQAATRSRRSEKRRPGSVPWFRISSRFQPAPTRSEEHTSELQSRRDLVCRLLLEKKKIQTSLAVHPTHLFNTTHIIYIFLSCE